MTLVLIGKDLVLEASTTKIEDKQIPGIYIYIIIHPPGNYCNISPFPSTFESIIFRTSLNWDKFSRSAEGIYIILSFNDIQRQPMGQSV